MRHLTRTASFNRPFKQRIWLIRNLLASLVEHERISTTVAKAKELRRHAERAITLGKKGGLSNRRLLMSRYPNKKVVAKVFDVLAPRYGSRNGGYTRVVRLGNRPGDNASMAFIEFIDADLNAKFGSIDKKPKKKEKVAKEAKVAKAAKAPKEQTAKSKAKAAAKATKKSKTK